MSVHKLDTQIIELSLTQDAFADIYTYVGQVN